MVKSMEAATAGDHHFRTILPCVLNRLSSLICSYSAEACLSLNGWLG